MPHPTRRLFLSAAAVTSAIAIVPRHVLGGPGNTPPSEKLNVAGIGVGGQGSGDLGNAAATENIVAFCDVDKRAIANNAKRHPKAKPHTDFRKMLDEMKEIDAIICATPDHLHAIVTLTAM